jgi:hypothetical protein
MNLNFELEVEVEMGCLWKPGFGNMYACRTAAVPHDDGNFMKLKLGPDPLPA